jgi:hypothetical protein
MRKHRWSPTLRGVAWMAKCLAISLVLAGTAGLSFADIQLNVSQIPPSPGTLKRMKLSRAAAPTAFVQSVLANSAPTARLQSLAQSSFAQTHGITAATSIQAAIEKDHVIATVDTSTGHVDVFPSLDSLTPLAAVTDGKTIPGLPQAVLDQASAAAANVLRQGVFPADVTRPVLDKPLTLVTAQYNQGATKGSPATMNGAKSGPLLAAFPVRRQVGNLPVFGIGSRGSISVGANGKVNGLSMHFKSASENDTVTETRSQAQIADVIRGQLADLSAKGNVVVQDVQVGYYDGDANFLQPVYMFRAKVTVTPQAGGTKLSDDDYVIGYVPIGNVLEAIPTVNDPLVRPPNVPQGAPKNLPVSQLYPTEPPTQIAAAAKDIPPGDPTVGRYVVRNDYVGWVNSANGFWDGLQWSGYGGYFTNSQYYWAYQFEFYGSKNYYINAVHVAEVEAHGDWWLWTTYQNWGDVVYVDNIPYPGLGSSAGGVCAYFIIHSCEVVPSAADTGAWADKWWHIFQGLHSVLGYRTVMMIDDGVMWPFGVHMGWGWSLVSAWLNDVISSPAYWCWFGNCPGEVMHGVWKPYGRPSTISVCGHENDSVYYTAGVGPAGCLQNYWFY